MTDEFIEMKKAKGTKKCVIKKMLKFEDYKKCLFDNEPTLKSQQRFKSENHEVYTEKINKIALSSNDGKRIVALDGIILMDIAVKIDRNIWIKLVKKNNQGIGGNN